MKQQQEAEMKNNIELWELYCDLFGESDNCIFENEDDFIEQFKIYQSSKSDKNKDIFDNLSKAIIFSELWMLFSDMYEDIFDNLCEEETEQLIDLMEHYVTKHYTIDIVDGNFYLDLNGAVAQQIRADKLKIFSIAKQQMI